MVRAPARNPITGLCRRGAQRKHTYNSRWMHLEHAEVCNRTAIQTLWIQCDIEAYLGISTIMRMMMWKILILQGVFQSSNANFEQLLNFLIHLGVVHFDLFVSYITFWFRFDHLLHDIPLVEESQALMFMPRRNIRLDDWDDMDSKYFTSFSARDLRYV